MAQIIGGLTTSHVPAIGRAMEQNTQNDAKLKPFFDAFIPVHPWLEEAKPDVIVLVYQDHGTNFFLDNMPTFAVGAAHDYKTTDEGIGLRHARTFKGDAELSWHVVESLIEDEFDISVCQELKLDHAGITAGDLLWPDRDSWPVAIVPVELNIVQYPQPKPSRCYALGQAIGRAIRSYPKDLKVAVVASGGLSHQIARDGYINSEFDKYCMDKLVNDPEVLTRLSNLDYIEKAGAQGLEFITWLVMRGAVAGDVELVTSTYFTPLSHTGGAVMLLDARGHGAKAKSKAA